MTAHSTAFRTAPLTAALAAAFGCGASDDGAVLRVTAHVLASCPIEPSSAVRRTLEIVPFGEFGAGPEQLIPLTGAAPHLQFPSGTAALRASCTGGDSDLRFLGYAERGSRAWVPLLLWPEGAACSLGSAGQAASSYPAAGGGQAIGHHVSEHVLLIVGGRSMETPAAAEGALVFDSGTGVLSAVTESSLEEPRAFGTVTRLGRELLVAGGENPLRGDQGGAVVSPSHTAELFDPVERRFTGETIELSVERTRHSAVALVNGDTLLVGGRGPFGALNVLETVSAQTRRASVAGLAALLAPRYFPVVLPLDDERWFVGGGTAADGTPLSVVEWLSGDAREHLGYAAPPALLPRVDRAFAALPGGGVLAVGGCESREPQSAAETIDCAALCNRGCAPAVYDAVWILPDGQAVPLDFPIEAPRPLLLGGRDGRPLLATGLSPEAPLYRFDPWSARFELAPVLARPAPRAGAAHAMLDDDAFVWLHEGAAPSLFGLRASARALDVRGELLFRNRRNPAFPRDLVPDRPVGNELALGSDGALEFAPGSAVTVYVAAVHYAAFTLELEVAGEALPRVVLGTMELGGAEQPWPAGARSPLNVTRRGADVTLTSAELRVRYAAPQGAQRVGVRAPEQGLRLTRFAVERSAD